MKAKSIFWREKNSYQIAIFLSFFLHDNIVLLPDNIHVTILRVNIFILHVDTFERKGTYCHHSCEIDDVIT